MPCDGSLKLEKTSARGSKETGVPRRGKRVRPPVGVGGARDARHREVAALDGVVPEVEDHAPARCFEAHVLTLALEPGHADVLVISGLPESMLFERTGHGWLPF